LCRIFAENQSAMIRANVSIDTSEIRALARRLSPAQVNKAVSQGLNDSIRQGRTVAKKEVTRVYNLPYYRVSDRKVLKVDAARTGQLSAKLFASVSPIKLASFKGLKGDGISVNKTKSKGTTLKRGRSKVAGITRPAPRKPVTVSVLKGKTVSLPNAFIARMKSSGHVGVFQRKKPGRKNYDSAGAFRLRKGRGSRIAPFGQSDRPIGSLFTFTIHKAIANKRVGPKVINRMESALPNRVRERLKLQLNK